MSNFPDVPFTESTARISKPIISTPGDFGSQEPKFLDVIFIAIDFEYSHYSPKTGRIRLREVGISMLDTRNLCHQNISLKDVISTQHYRTATDTKEFLFGKSIDILSDELVLILKRLLYLEDESPQQIRNLILVSCHERQIHSTKVRWFNGPNYDYSKLKKEEVIYKVRFVHKYRVLPLHTAYASRASARDHVTWNAKTVTLPPPLSRKLVLELRIP